MILEPTSPTAVGKRLAKGLLLVRVQDSTAWTGGWITLVILAEISVLSDHLSAEPRRLGSPIETTQCPPPPLDLSHVRALMFFVDQPFQFCDGLEGA